MTSPFFGLDLALRALQAQQSGVDVTNHNVANANTPGFSRQSVEIVTTTPYTLPGMNRAPGAGQVGTGAYASGINRARDLFLDIQYRTEVGAQREAEVTQDALEEIEIVLNEPSSNGLNAMLSTYYANWQELAGDPSDPAVRATVVQQAVALSTMFNRIGRQLTEIGTSLNAQVKELVDGTNALTDQIAALNGQIVQIEVTGQRANDFRDRRDILLDQLAELVQITVSDNADGSVNVTIGGQALVTGTTAADLQTVVNGSGYWDVQVGGVAANLGNAKLSGLIATRDTRLPNYLGQINQIAADLIAATNAVHTTGFDATGTAGLAFFTGTDALTMQVNAAIVADPRLIAASSVANQAGNNVVALQIAQLRHTIGPPTTESAYGALISTLGVDNQAARGLAENQEALVNLIQRRRESLSGVSLDEETVHLLQYQRAYEAASRVISVIDEMLDKLINGTGAVGR